jgi:hypothetical protein
MDPSFLILLSNGYSRARRTLSNGKQEKSVQDFLKKISEQNLKKSRQKVRLFHTFNCFYDIFDLGAHFF